MAAIFYDAVAGNYQSYTLWTNPATRPNSIAIHLKGKNPGFAIGDKVSYKGASGLSFSGPIESIYVTPASETANPYYALFVPFTDAAKIQRTEVGTVSPVTAATPVKVAAPAANAQPPVVSASTILKAGGTAAPAATPEPEIEPAKASLLPFGLTTKAIIAAGIVGIAAFLLTRKGKGKK